MLKVSNDLFYTLLDAYTTDYLVNDYGDNDVTEYFQDHPEVLLSFIEDFEDSEINTELLEDLCNNSVLLDTTRKDAYDLADELDMLGLDDSKLPDKNLDEDDLLDAMDQEGIWYKDNDGVIVAVIPHH